jgi:hypothetical protein
MTIVKDVTSVYKCGVGTKAWPQEMSMAIEKDVASVYKCGVGTMAGPREISMMIEKRCHAGVQTWRQHEGLAPRDKHGDSKKTSHRYINVVSARRHGPER